MAPSFELPALVDGDHRQVALEEHLGEDVVILAFYPADFNPACNVESDLDQLDLFTMQQDVTVLAVGPDTLFAHEAFAEEYDLKIPLLSDTKREAAEAYDVAYEDRLGQHLIARAVFVIDYDREIVYTWSSKDPASLANVDEIKNALGETGGDDTAFSRYRVGHAHYVEGRRAFTSAMDSFSDSDWMIAQSDFKRARDEFEEAEQHFTSAGRFVDDDRYQEHYDAAKDKASALWQAADWLGRAASEYSSGAGAAGQQLRSDAQGPLENARAIGESIDPDEWPPTEPPVREAPEDDRPAYLVDDDDDEPATLEVDIDAEGVDDAEESTGSNEPTGGVDEAGIPAEEGSVDVADDRAEGAEPAGDDIDDEELAEIEAEIAASGPDEPLDEGPPDERRNVVDEPPSGPVDDEPALDEIDDDLSGGGGASLEPDAGSRNDAGDRAGSEDLTAVEEEFGTVPDDAAASDGDELEEIEPESTSLEGIPSEEDLVADETDEDDG